MKKILVGVGVFWFVLILVGATISLVDSQKRATCDRLATLSSVDEFNETSSQKGYALHFPVR